MRPYHSPARARAIALAPALHRREVLLGAAVLALATVFATLAAGWQLGGVALNLLGMAA